MHSTKEKTILTFSNQSQTILLGVLPTQLFLRTIFDLGEATLGKIKGECTKFPRGYSGQVSTNK